MIGYCNKWYQNCLFLHKLLVKGKYLHKKNGLVFTKPLILKILYFVAKTGVEDVISGNL